MLRQSYTLVVSAAFCLPLSVPSYFCGTNLYFGLSMLICCCMGEKARLYAYSLTLFDGAHHTSDLSWYDLARYQHTLNLPFSKFL